MLEFHVLNFRLEHFLPERPVPLPRVPVRALAARERRHLRRRLQVAGRSPTGHATKSVGQVSCQSLLRRNMNKSWMTTFKDLNYVQWIFKVYIWEGRWQLFTQVEFIPWLIRVRISGALKYIASVYTGICWLVMHQKPRVGQSKILIFQN